jgi:hypothetical protein
MRRICAGYSYIGCIIPRANLSPVSVLLDVKLAIFEQAGAKWELSRIRIVVFYIFVLIIGFSGDC